MIYFKVLFLSLLSLQATANTEGKAELRVRPEVSIAAVVEVSQRPLLRLTDIAVVLGGSDTLLAQLEQIVLREDSRELALAPVILSQEILAKVRHAMQTSKALKEMNPSFNIPSQIQVNFSSVPISREEVQRKIHNLLKARCGECDYKVSIQSTPVPAQRHWEIDFSQLSAKGGGFLLPLKEGQTRDSKWISGTIRVSKLTPVTTRMILQGERLQQGDVRLATTDVTYAKDGVLSELDVQGQVALRALPVGTPVWSADLQREPAAKKGQIVKALMGDENFEISLQVQAEDSGFIGDLVKVKNMENQKILSGLIIEKGVVKLQ